MAENTIGGWGGSRRAGGEASDIVFTNVRILDGSGEPPYAGEVTVAGNRIKSVTRSTPGASRALATPPPARSSR